MGLGFGDLVSALFRPGRNSEWRDVRVGRPKRVLRWTTDSRQLRSRVETIKRVHRCIGTYRLEVKEVDMSPLLLGVKRSNNTRNGFSFIHDTAVQTTRSS